MQDIPWTAIAAVGGATIAIGAVAALAAWAVPYILSILP